MIPKKIHYCWFGGGEMPELAKRCVASWHEKMPDWTYVLWNEESFDVGSAPRYVREAYEAKKFAFVSDYVRLHALEKEGGVYLDVDVEVYKSFEPLLMNHAFTGFEGNKRCSIMTSVLASEPNGRWVSEAKHEYDTRPFVMADGSLDLTTNTAYFTDRMEEQGFAADGKEQDFGGLHIYPVEYFCPMQTSGEYLRTENTYCEHTGLHSWSTDENWKSRLLKHVSPAMRTKIILLKRKIEGGRWCGRGQRKRGQE